MKVPKTVLLVEDQAIIALVEKKVLEKAGYSVRIVDNGEEAIQVALAYSDIDLILMDIDLGPGIDGTLAAQRILAERAIPIVFLSSHTEPEIVEKTEGITSFGYIVKNSGDTVLLASLRMAFRLAEANKELQQSNDQLRWWDRIVRFVVEHDPTAIAIFDNDMNFLYVSTRFLRDYGLKEHEVIGKYHYDLFPDMPERWRAFHRRALAGEVLKSDDDFFVRPDGSIDYTRWELRPWYGADGKIGGIIAYTEVLTELKKSRQELTLSEHRFRTVMDSMQDIVFTLDTQRRLTAVYGPWVERWGLTPEYFLGRTFAEILGPEAAKVHDRAFDQAIAGAFTIYDWRVAQGEGGGFFQTSLSPIIGDDGSVEGVVGIGRDISDLVRATESRKKSENYLKTVLNTTEVGFWIVNANGRLSNVNQAYARMSGYSIEELETLEINDLDAVEDPLDTLKHLENIKIKGSDLFETKHRRKDGTIFDVQVSVSRFDDDGDFALICFCQDITESKALRAEVQRRSEILEKLSHQLPGAVYLFQLYPDQRFALPFGSEKFFDLYGIGTEELNETPDLVMTRIVEEDRDRIRNSIAYSARALALWEEEFRILHPQLGIRWLRGSGRPESQNDSSILWYGYLVDVSESKKVEQALWENQERWHIALDSAGAAILDWRPQEDRIFLSANFSHLLGYQIGEQAVRISEIRALFHPDDLPGVLKALNDVETTSTTIFEYQARMRNNFGGWVWMLGRGKVLEKDSAGRALRIIGVTTDISELKNAQARIEQLVQEQATLLKETHHRIKNNFASAESLLNLQTHPNTPPEARAIIDGARSRISSMRVLYDKLVNAENFESLPLRPYLSELVSTIGEVYLDSRPLTLETDIDEVELSSRRAFPLGAIVVELVTNSIKYAYPNGTQGTIKVGLKVDGADAILSVVDRGQGYDPRQSKGRSESLGLTLVKMMAAQIHGNLLSEAIPGKGTRTDIRFQI